MKEYSSKLLSDNNKVIIVYTIIKSCKKLITIYKDYTKSILETLCYIEIKYLSSLDSNLSDKSDKLDNIKDWY